jgi:Ner family transcriptional regulator
MFIDWSHKHKIVFMIAAMNTNKGVNVGDWHPADVVAALRKGGTSLRKVGLAHGYKQIQNVLTRPWWVVEQLVAKELGLKAEQIWPTRYAPGTNREHAKALTRNSKALEACAKKPGRKAAPKQIGTGVSA